MKKFLILYSFLIFFAINSFAQEKSYTVLDVRTPAEYSDSHAKDAINIDFLDGSFKDKISKLDRNAHYKIYCRSGNRSGQAEKLMRSMGFKNIENVGSLGQAVQKLNLSCEGIGRC